MKPRVGFTAILVACVLSAVMGAAFFKAHLEDPKFSSFSGSFVRVLVNLIFVFAICKLGRGGESLVLSPHRHRSLWLWGVFGALTVTSYFFALNLIGSATTALLAASSGIFIAALSPVLARQPTSPVMWPALGGALLGLYMLSTSTLLQSSSIGAASAVLSGLFAAIAYLMIARTRVRYSTVTIMMTWCISALIAHGLVFCLTPTVWPTGPRAWIFLLLAGAAASLAMHYTAIAFQNAPAAMVGALSYLAPVISLGLDVVLFGFTPSLQACVGAVLIVAFGAVLPMTRQRTNSERRGII